MWFLGYLMGVAGGGGFMWGVATSPDGPCAASVLGLFLMVAGFIVAENESL
jgi:hypothetical protein